MNFYWDLTHSVCRDGPEALAWSVKLVVKAMQISRDLPNMNQSSGCVRLLCLLKSHVWMLYTRTWFLLKSLQIYSKNQSKITVLMHVPGLIVHDSLVHVILIKKKSRFCNLLSKYNYLLHLRNDFLVRLISQIPLIFQSPDANLE